MLVIIHTYEDSTIRANFIPGVIDVESFECHFTEAFIKVVNLWSWVLTLFGYSAKYLNRKSKILNYSNEAVYPFYILHQTIMITIAYFLIELEWSFGSKFSIMTFGTFGFSWVIYEFLIRRWRFIRPLFGLKKK